MATKTRNEEKQEGPETRQMGWKNKSIKETEKSPLALRLKSTILERPPSPRKRSPTRRTQTSDHVRGRTVKLYHVGDLEVPFFGTVSTVSWVGARLSLGEGVPCLCGVSHWE